jgi:hypothetical protein
MHVVLPSKSWVKRLSRKIYTLYNEKIEVINDCPAVTLPVINDLLEVTLNRD